MPEYSLPEIASLYKEGKIKIIEIEGITRVSAIATKFNENTRHALDHLILSEDPDIPVEDRQQHLAESYGHVENLAPDACQAICGYFHR